MRMPCKISVVTVLLSLFLSAGDAAALFEESRTGGMSEVNLANTRIKVEGGFIESFTDVDVYVRAKAVEVSLNIDNSYSKEGKIINFIVSNINLENFEIIGWSGEKPANEGNNLSFPVKVEPEKVAVYKIAPKEQTDEFKFMVFGESRKGRHVFKRIIGDINYRKPLFAVSCGDMVEEPTSGAYKDFIKEVEMSKLPFLTVPGSSEVADGGRHLYEDYLGTTYYSFDFKNAHFIILDDGDGRMGEEQFLWLEKDLMQNKAVHTFVFMHQPPFDPRPGRKQPLEKGGQHRRLSGLLEKYKVSMVFTSGIHSYFREVRGGITYVISGGGGSPLASADSFYNYIIVEVKGDKANDKLIKLKAPPVSLYNKIVSDYKLRVRNAFQSHPVKSTIITIVAFFFLLILFRAIYKKIFNRPKKGRLSF